MALQLSALDAVSGGIATAFFGGLLAGGAYILKQMLALKEQVASLAGRMGQMDAIQGALGTIADQAMSAKALSGRSKKKGGDGAEGK